MTSRRTIAGSLLLVVALLAALALASGCGGEPKTATGNTSSTCPTTVPQDSSTQPQGTTPSDSTAQSKSEQALEQAKAEGKPVLLKFGSDTCSPCIEINKNIEQIKPEYEGKALFIIVNVNDQAEYNLAMKYNIQTIPTTIFIKKDGTSTNGFVGVLTPEQLRKELDSII